MTQEEIVKIVCDYFKSLEDAKVADYERDLNDPSWSNTDAYCYTPEASTKYATVEENKGDVTIHYNEFTVFVRNMPSVKSIMLKSRTMGKKKDTDTVRKLVINWHRLLQCITENVLRTF